MTEIQIRKINLSDAMEIQKISREDLGYKSEKEQLRFIKQI